LIAQPSTLGELSELLAGARQPVGEIDLRALDRLIEHTPEDMTATVQAGLTLAALQKQLAAGGQWLPLDPPGARELTIARLLAFNASGPRRFGFGTARDYVIGLKVVLADGRIIQSGGKVVKNVAGYDLAKLFIGSRGSLGVIVEASFKLRPCPGREAFVRCRCDSADWAGERLGAVLDSELAPVVVDLHNLGSPNFLPWCMVIGFAGDAEEVEWQLAKARELGFADACSLDYDEQFHDAPGAGEPRKVSVLPSKLIETARQLRGPFVARAGNGILYHRDNMEAPKIQPPLELTRRLKQSFDPKNILPELSP
jgi:glycolate oxidase FAD binding subunit